MQNLNTTLHYYTNSQSQVVHGILRVATCESRATLQINFFKDKTSLGAPATVHTLSWALTRDGLKCDFSFTGETVKVRFQSR